MISEAVEQETLEALRGIRRRLPEHTSYVPEHTSEVPEPSSTNMFINFGLQFILSGDIFQLPPIGNELYGDQGNISSRMSGSRTCSPHVITLVTIHRQADIQLINSINEIERGQNISAETETYIKNLSRNLPHEDEKDAVHLYATNLEADIYYHAQLHKIQGGTSTFHSEDNDDRYYLNKMLAPTTLALKQGCKVMLLVILSSTFVNGSQGVVSGIDKDSVSVMFNVGGKCLTWEGQIIY